MEKNYSDYHTVEYPENSGEFYMFDPYNMLYGHWKVLSKNNKPTKVATQELQKKLNEYFFGLSEIPSLYERFMKASKEEREKLQNVSMSWLQLKIKAIKEKNSQDFVKNKQFEVGRLYFYIYDAKHKNTLPVWDVYPLIIVLKFYGDGFLGLNLHYLPNEERMLFLSKLMSLKHYNSSNDTLYVNVSYDLLKSSKRFSEFGPCVKRYLHSHVRSNILPIESHEWAFAAGLSLEKFIYNKKK